MKRLANYAHLSLNVLGLFAALAMAGVLIHRHNLRLDLTPTKKYTLSEHSVKIVDSIHDDVEVLAFVRREDPRTDFIHDLLWRVNSRNPRIRYRLIDLNRSPSLARRYNVDAYGAVVVERGRRRKQFTNIREELLVAALLQVTRDEEKVAYFLTGHGEGNIDDSDRNRGYSTAKVVLEQEFYTVRPLSLLGGRGVPPDAAVVILAGPKSDLLPQELLALDEYLRKGGAVLALVDPGEGRSLAAFLRRYRLELPEEIVADGDFRLAAGEELTFRVPERPSDAVVARTLEADPVFSLARPIGTVPAEGDDHRIVVRDLLRTSSNSWAIPFANGEIRGDLEYDPKRDRRGPFAVGVEVAIDLETPKPAAVNLGEAEELLEPGQRHHSRLIVYGDADFANNFFIELLGNRDLLVNTVNWLALEESLIGVRPARKQPGTEQFFVSSRQGYWAFLLGTVVEPAIFLILGIAVFVWRKLR
jgi:ABC-type uncharacterized transport system involved in gliding motility auxiliary subunit